MTRSTDRLTTWLAASGAVRPEERRTVGIVGGLLFIAGGLVLAAFTVLPGISRAHTGQLLLLAAIACTWGLLAVFVLDWDHAPGWVVPPISVAGLILIGLALASSGGSESPAWIYLFLAVVFAAYFYPSRTAYLFFAGCVVTHASVLAYDSRSLSDDFLAQFAIAAPAYVLMGSAIVAGRQRMWELRRRAERLAAEQGALRRVATAVVSGDSVEQTYERAAFEVAQLLNAGAAGILRLETRDLASVVGSWADHPGGRYAPGTPIPVRPGGDVERALQTGRAVRVVEHPPDSPVARLGYSSSIVAPIRMSGRTWGVLAVSAAADARFSPEDEQHLIQFGDLLATAIGSIEDRTKLAQQASTDSLTGLANQRSVRKRLTAELARAVRHGTPLSVAMIDIDHFKSINDNAGHDNGDEVLVAIAQCLTKLARAEDTIGRMGGDEFAWVLPETTRDEAMVAVERARRMIAAQLRRPWRVTVSAGICDTGVTQSAPELINLADVALYWSKSQGRNRSWIYDPAVVSELSAKERAERLQRSQALLGLRALARAVDAKEPATRRHSERVSDLVGKLALATGWSAERAQLLAEAALVHDVGKIGVPERLLLKPGRLTDAERDQIKAHAELAARIAEDVLSPEQVEWIRTHHERPDGTGYPQGLSAQQIPEGGALLAAAESWDAMTISRPYSPPKRPDEALSECISLIGRQFTREAVAALVELHSSGELTEALVSVN